MTNLTQIKQSELKDFRKKQWLRQNKICPILKQEISFEKSVFDHQHKLKKEKAGPEWKGLLRGVLHSQANVMEGKIARLYKRYGLNKFIELPELLRNIADYLEDFPMKNLKERYIHPKEGEKPKKLGKREYNKIKKYYFEMYPKKKKMISYPKSGKLTKQFEKILKDLDKYQEKK